MIEIDGATGGGSLVRLAVGLSAATGVPVRIVNIRGARPNPGLQAQHVAGVQVVAELCSAEVRGLRLGSRELEFYPGLIRRTSLQVEISTAGSIGLALQPVQIACLSATTPLTVSIVGGATFGRWAPPVPFLAMVNFPLLRRFGYPAQIDIERHGFYPEGGARARARFFPPRITGPIELLERGNLIRIGGVSVASHHLQRAQVAHRQARAAQEVLRPMGVPVEIEVVYADTVCPGSGISLWAEFEGTILGADAIGEPGKRSEAVGREAAEGLLGEIHSAATVDRHMADQLIPFVGLFGGVYRFRELTDHMRVNMDVVSRFTESTFQIEGGVLRVQKPSSPARG
ncbi:MAG: RNA 3'-terminal phosphate cyclase [Armatimonadota bacterium]|nr:RNA 3'-terminal phosphate cyclase [Armatimonadota bacterium]MDR5703850.1 RNA 3'-terminal phosphate cyclase [Armatimonadota bacterium]